MPPELATTDPDATVPPAPPAKQPTLPPQEPVLTSAYSESAPAARNGAAVPGYEILRELGRGGMGVVYQARHTKLDRVVALKMILAGGHAGEADLAQLKTEAESVARLQHPHIVQIFEVGEHGGLPFFSLKYCPGGSLDRKLNGTPLPPKEAAALVEKLARAMRAAHDKGVVHRDLKPANVLLAEDGEPKITDFGLAKKLDADAGQTRTGAVMGTPSYMAPEQAGGKTSEMGPLCDVYALGAILYECLTGRPPFKAATAMDTMMQVVADEPAPPRQLQPLTPRDLETVCLKCLQKEPAKRYASAAALPEDLHAFQAGEPIRARPVAALERAAKWVRRNPAVAALATAVVAVLLLGTAVSTVFGFLANANAVEASRKADDEKAARTEANANALEAGRNALEARHKADDEKTARTEAERQLERAKSFLFTAQLQRVAPIYGTSPLDALALLEDANACPKDHRDLAWRFYEGYCRSGMLDGHGGSVFSVALSGDGKTLVSGSEDGTVKVWDVDTEKVRFTLKGNTGFVLSVALSRDGKTIVWGSQDGMARVWRVGTGKAPTTLKGHTNIVNSVALSGDGKTIASGSTDNTIKVWDAGAGTERATLKGHAGAVMSVALSGDGKTLISGSEDKTVKVWDVGTEKERATLKGHTEGVLSVALSGDGKTIVSGSNDFTVKVWDVGTQKERATLKGHQGQVSSVALSGDAKTLISGGFLTVTVWDTGTGQEIATFKGHTLPVLSVALSDNGKTLASGGMEDIVKIWNLDAGNERATLQGHAGAINSVALSGDGKTLVSGSEDMTVKVWDVGAKKERATLKGHTSPVLSVALSGDGKTIASGSEDFTVKVWDVDTNLERATLKGHTDAIYRGGVRSVALSGDGQTLVSGSADGTVEVWDVGAGKVRATLKGHTGPVDSVALSGDGMTLVSGSDDLTIKVWDVLTGKERATLKGHGDPVNSVALSRDGKTLVSGAGYGKSIAGALGSGIIPGFGDNTIKVWDVGTGQERATLKGHTDRASVALSSDGKTLVSGSMDGTIKVWVHGGSD